MMHMSPYQMPMQLSMMQMRLLYDVNFPCRDAQFIHDDANAPLWVCHDANAPLWICYDANAFLLDANAIYPKISFIFQIEASLELGTKMLSKLDLFFQRLFLFIPARLERPMHHSCPKNMFILP